MDIENIVMSLIGAFIAIVLVGAVIMPAITSPTLPVQTSVANDTVLTGITSTGEHNFTLSSIDAGEAGTIRISWVGLNATNNVSVAIGATTLGTFTNASTNPVVLNIAAGTLSDSTKVVYTASQALTTHNITAATIYYAQNPESDSWDSAVQTFWTVLLGIVVVAALLLYLMKLW